MYEQNVSRCEPVRQTRRSASPSASARVTSSPKPAHAASAKITGCSFGARPLSEIARMRATTRAPSSAIASARFTAFSLVSRCSVA